MVKKHVSLLIIDYRVEGFKRYAVEISRNLERIGKDAIIAAGYMKRTSKVSLPEIDYIFCIEDYNLNVKKIFDEFSPKAILLFAHRFFDYLFTLEAHKRGIKVFNFQHAFYAENTSISKFNKDSFVGLIKYKQQQFFLYLRCLMKMDLSPLNTAKALIYFLRGQDLYHVMHRMFGQKCEADISFVFGNYWIGFYKKVYLEHTSKYFIVGYPELENSNEVVDRKKFNKELPIVCYLAQTAVEDGTVMKNDFDLFLSRLNKCLNNCNLVIKFHPRSDEKLYETLIHGPYKDHISIWRDTKFPIADAYIGHDSTVLARALHLSDKVLIVEFNENRKSFFSQYSKYMASVNDDLKIILEQMLENKDNSINQDIHECAYVNQNGGALVETASIIAKYISKKDLKK